MALKGLPPSPASGDSNSPSPELPSDGASTNASPLSASTSLYISQASDEGESAGNHSSRGTPTRFMDATRANAAGKGGCWYAYLVHCIRSPSRLLTPLAPRLPPRPSATAGRVGPSLIHAVPSSPARPLCHPNVLTLNVASTAGAQQDKEKVAAYKADIKEKLSRMGLIRGQPRQPWHAGSLSTSQPPTPGIAGPGPRTTLRRSASAREAAYHRESGYMRGAPYHLPGLPGPASGKQPSSPCRAAACVLVLVPRGRAKLLLNFAYLEREATAPLTRTRRRART
ncbi:hypothetical protein ONZ51_g2118 [Trametes cubensis]|uniref:Uncharacterized protein n=1 Tax=Trametes cubensis TaxID=1111947 RepID=A0AAD7XH03_9APHY|nr:hypothetical protein ONZ51_g2118 [Trametes cubensis]